MSCSTRDLLSRRSFLGAAAGAGSLPDVGFYCLSNILSNIRFLLGEEPAEGMAPNFPSRVIRASRKLRPVCFKRDTYPVLYPSVKPRKKRYAPNTIAPQKMVYDLPGAALIKPHAVAMIPKRQKSPPTIMFPFRENPPLFWGAFGT